MHAYPYDGERLQVFAKKSNLEKHVSEYILTWIWPIYIRAFQNRWLTVSNKALECDVCISRQFLTKIAIKYHFKTTCDICLKREVE